MTTHLLKAIIFDVDGTLANTERDGHRVAFNLAFKECGLDWHWSVDLYGELLAVTGGKERIQHYVSQVKFDTANIESFCKTLHQLKTKYYLDLLTAGKISLRDGVLDLLPAIRRQNIILAIATTTTPANVSTLLINQLGEQSVGWFEVIGAGDIVANKKPASDIYDYVLQQLNLNANECIAIEDSNNGLRSAKQANLATVVVTNNYTKDDDFTGADLVINKFGNKNDKFTTVLGNNFNYDWLNVELLIAIHQSL